MKMAKLASPKLASVTMCNDKIVELNSKFNGIRWFGISYTIPDAKNEASRFRWGVQGKDDLSMT